MVILLSSTSSDSQCADK